MGLEGVCLYAMRPFHMPFRSLIQYVSSALFFIDIFKFKSFKFYEPSGGGLEYAMVSRRSADGHDHAED